MQSIFPLTGSIKHYDWGGFSFLAELTGSHNPHHLPYAEYWLGVHPSEPSKISFETQSFFLNDFIRENKSAALGEAATRFDNLPFLLKLLDVREMLSIQVHPDKKQAEEGFQNENEKGIPLDDPKRNYRDDNHKPEMMIALSDFWLLHGFKPEKELLKTISKVKELKPFESCFDKGNYHSLYENCFFNPKMDAVLASLAQRILPLYEKKKLKKDSPDYWAAKAMKTFCSEGNFDRGIFSIYFFNLVHLKKGEGIYQGAGLPHAYLEGQNVEVMANSDNVLRAGLTSKHIDKEELFRLVKFQPTEPSIIRPKRSHLSAYPTPAKEFAVTKICPAKKEVIELNAANASVMIVLEGDVGVAGSQDLLLHRGNAIFITGGSSIQITGDRSEAYFVTIPEDKKASA